MNWFWIIAGICYILAGLVEINNRPYLTLPGILWGLGNIILGVTGGK